MPRIAEQLPPHVDVVVLGAGPAGSVTALELARLGHRVLLVERTRAGPAHFKPGETLPPSANGVLQELGLLPLLGPDLALPCPGNQSAWGGRELVDQDFLFSPHGLGAHLERPGFEAMLRARAEQEGVVLGDRSDTKTPARYRVDATGRARVLLRRMGIKAAPDDRLVANIAEFQCGRPGDDLDARTLIEAEPDGWWYTARVPGGRRLIMFFTDADLPAARETRAWSGFQRRLGLTRHTRLRLSRGEYTPSASIRTRSAAGSVAERFVGPGWMAVGDSASSFDPLSSQGMLSAMTAARAAAQAIDALLGNSPQSAAAAEAAYIEHVTRTRAEYLKQHRRYYQAERRYADRTFWRRRHGR